MPAMTDPEMTAFLGAEAEARTLSNIARRAASLFSDGYSASLLAPGHYAVFSPSGDVYAVFLSDLPADQLFGSSCSCPCFGSRKTCKHLQALVLEAAQEAAQVAEYEARQEAILGNDDDRYPEF